MAPWTTIAMLLAPLLLRLCEGIFIASPAEGTIVSCEAGRPCRVLIRTMIERALSTEMTRCSVETSHNVRMDLWMHADERVDGRADGNVNRCRSACAWACMRGRIVQEYGSATPASNAAGRSLPPPSLQCCARKEITSAGTRSRWQYVCWK